MKWLGLLAASCTTTEGGVEVLRLGVVPGYRGRGLGVELMVYAENYLTKRGAASIELSIVADFLRLQGFYERLGYVASGARSVENLPFQVMSLEKHTARS